MEWHALNWWLRNSCRGTMFFFLCWRTRLVRWHYCHTLKAISPGNMVEFMRSLLVDREKSLVNLSSVCEFSAHANCNGKFAEYRAYCRLIVIEFVLTFRIACLQRRKMQRVRVSTLWTTKWMFALFCSWIYTTFISCNKNQCSYAGTRRATCDVCGLEFAQSENIYRIIK